MAKDNVKDNELKDEAKLDNRNGNSGKSGKGRGKRSRNRNSRSKGASDRKPVGNINDASYYYSDPTILRQIMNFSFNQFGGVPIDLEAAGRDAKYEMKVPMIMTIWMNSAIPCATGSEFQNTGIMTAALRNFLMLSAGNMKSTNYAPQDVVLLQLAICELVKMVSWCTRLFGVLPLFNYRNRMYPEKLVQAMGIDVDDFFDNAADYRARFNRILTLASKIPFPASMPAIVKAAQQYANIYVDSPNSALAQTYILNPYHYWWFNEEYDENGAGLETDIWLNPDTPTKFKHCLDCLEQMISGLINSTSLNYIYSDILRLINTGTFNQVISFAPVAEGYVQAPIYNEEIKNWIHNATIVGIPIYEDFKSQYSTPYNDVSCNAGNNTIKYCPEFKMDCCGGNDLLIDFDTDQVTDELKVEATRLSARWEVTETGDIANHDYRIMDAKLAVLDNYITFITIVDGISNSPARIPRTMYDLGEVNMSAHNTARMISRLDKFAWGPMIYWSYGLSTTDPNALDVSGELNFYTDLGYKDLKDIYDYEVIKFYQIN